MKKNNLFLILASIAINLAGMEAEESSSLAGDIVKEPGIYLTEVSNKLGNDILVGLLKIVPREKHGRIKDFKVPEDRLHKCHNFKKVLDIVKPHTKAQDIPDGLLPADDSLVGYEGREYYFCLQFENLQARDQIAFLWITNKCNDHGTWLSSSSDYGKQIIFPFEDQITNFHVVVDESMFGRGIACQGYSNTINRRELIEQLHDKQKKEKNETKDN